METKKVLIPTDFSVKSLELVRKTVEDNKNVLLEIVLLHGMHLSNSITDLLFFSKSRMIKELQTEEFTEATNVLKNKYPIKLNSLYVDLITSKSKAYFLNYLEAANIDEIVVPQKGFLDFKKAKGFDTLSLLDTCGIPCAYINFDEEMEGVEVGKAQFANVFLTGIK
ncbi:hypothetical protein [Allomuricauda sp. M10]|uniref:hypothetical protein n=1 Tax=Allomuricauda sp. M10 TaxID=2683292 RepID=UPI001D193857|nr:hypothetical protein [Muricauda sp. M10]